MPSLAGAASGGRQRVTTAVEKGPLRCGPGPQRRVDAAASTRAASGASRAATASEAGGAAAASARWGTPAALQRPARRRPEGVPAKEPRHAPPARSPGGAFGSPEAAAAPLAASPAARTPLLAARSKEEPCERPPAAEELLGAGPMGTRVPFRAGAPSVAHGVQHSTTRKIQVRSSPSLTASMGQPLPGRPRCAPPESLPRSPRRGRCTRCGPGTPPGLPRFPTTGGSASPARF